MSKNNYHLTDDQLAALALGHVSAEIALHLERCNACRAEAGVYRSIVQSTRQVFCDDPVPVNLIRCEQSLSAEGTRCEVDDHTRQVHISLRRIDGVLLGQLTAELDAQGCWHDAPVRLFDAQGLVASSRVSPNGNFRLVLPDSGRRYSLGLVLPRQGIPELQIIGHGDRL